MGSALTYTGGYDDGMRDAMEGQPRAYPRLVRTANADPRRVGYDAGYADGETRREASPPPVPSDPRVGPHPFVGPHDICQLPGCNRSPSGSIHDMDSPDLGGRSADDLALLEAAKAVARGVDRGIILAAPGTTDSYISLTLLGQALVAVGHPTRAPRPSERAMADTQGGRVAVPAQGGIEQYQSESR
jgi:hypothetical protein